MERASRRDQILRSAVAVFSQKGYNDAAISDIITRAGIARGTFYLHFTSKRAIFDDILELCFRRILDHLRPVSLSRPLDRTHVLEQVRDNARRLARLIASERALFHVLLAEPGGLDPVLLGKVTDFYARLAQWIAESLDLGIRHGVVRACNTKLAAHALLGMCRGVFGAWVNEIEPIAEDDFIEENLRFLRSGLLLIEKGENKRGAPGRRERAERTKASAKAKRKRTP